MSTKAKADRARERTRAGRLANRKRAEAAGDAVAAMTPAERRRLVADYERNMADTAPSAEAAGSDLLRVLMAVGLEFVRRYYPGATSAAFNVSYYTRGGPPDRFVHIDVPLEPAGPDVPATVPAPPQG